MGHCFTGKLSNSQGFSLMEIILATSLLAVGIIAFLSIANKALDTTDRGRIYYALDDIILKAEEVLYETPVDEVLEKSLQDDGWCVQINQATVVYSAIDNNPSKPTIDLVGTVYKGKKRIGKFCSIKEKHS